MDNSRRRALKVIKLLAEYQQPDLWHHVVNDITEDGKLNLYGVVDLNNVPDLADALALGETSGVTRIE